MHTETHRPNKLQKRRRNEGRNTHGLLWGQNPTHYVCVRCDRHCSESITSHVERICIVECDAGMHPGNATWVEVVRQSLTTAIDVWPSGRFSARNEYAIYVCIQTNSNFEFETHLQIFFSVLARDRPWTMSRMQSKTKQFSILDYIHPFQWTEKKDAESSKHFRTVWKTVCAANERARKIIIIIIMIHTYLQIQHRPSSVFGHCVITKISNSDNRHSCQYLR